jgi:hypothetical protein
MVGIDDPFDLDGERTTLRQLASQGRLMVHHSLDYSPVGSTQSREAWWADVPKGEGRNMEISRATYEALKALGVPDNPSP